MRLRIVGSLVALALASGLYAAPLAQLTTFNLIWTDNISDGDFGLPPVPITLGINTASTNNLDLGGLDSETPPPPPTLWVQPVSYTADAASCVIENRPGTPVSPGVLSLYYNGELLPTTWGVGTKAGASWLSWTDVDPYTGPGDMGWTALTLTIDQGVSYNMLTGSQVAVTVQRSLGPFWEINGTYVVPEPGTLALLSSGLAGLVALARKR